MNNPLALKAVRLYLKAYSNGAIARELNVHATTVGNWLRTLEAPKRAIGGKATYVKPTVTPMMQEMLDKAAAEEAAAGAAEPQDQLADDLETNLDNMAHNAAAMARHEASLQEDKDMMELAESQSSSADKYQHYMAAAAIKLVRDSMRGIRGPKTVRELSELDQLIRRNLGLGAKGGSGGGGTMQIDLTILNNSKADAGKGSLKHMKEDQVVDAEILDKKDTDEN